MGSGTLRLFVGVWPPEEVLVALEGLDRLDHPEVRWTSRDQWHVTLRFLGSVPTDEVDGLVEALRAAVAGSGPVPVTLSAASGVMSRSVLVLPVAGLDDLAASVVEATRSVGEAPPDRPFRGHLTLARGRGRRPIPRAVRTALPSLPAPMVWTVEHVDLIRSDRTAAGAVYEAVASLGL